ncbi:hypothetical protein DPMN_064042 [Dreissena polymorpha]|uniref:Uncharacterized protein n=1 Tax=Dreissena polymorpha TaxID=45954 RepID=A0A9D4CCW4_DREPO|nr:hypothetical protein DPMN_064040 [Dreissena polymorpha]KAH3721125.1 hypothetical protein DPMN_064042 [Dreissena polymorpha]
MHLHQLSHQLKALHIPGRLHSTVWLLDLDALRGHKMHDTGLCTQVSPNNAPRILHFRKHKTKCYNWPTRTPLCVSQKTKAGFVLIRHQARLIVQGCAPGNAT